ncbi:Indigoidine synthase A like protein-domain-containing protein [Mycena rebaudengoi]|nr:Indigoidine synthase A like protein-domain-containing protein [Mycena rebaudengoi]
MLLRARAFDRISFARSASRLSRALQNGAPIDIHPEVEEALHAGRPTVALETALTTHGLPPPINLQVTRDLENVVRSTGCIPATIGIVAGRVKIGLENSDLERLADGRGKPAKVSRRDIAPALALKADGGTTCSATLIFAALAGIKVFATGGLGGVHRGGEESMDISADLHELTRCQVGLCSAGVKSILDIGRCVETLGVPVVTYGKTTDFPAFFSPRSGFQTAWNINDPATAARMLYSQWQLGMKNGALIAVPIPEEFAESGELIQQAVTQAVQESVTPWLLKRVSELTNNRSLDSNIALLKNTALTGGQIAFQYSQLLANEPNVNGKTYTNGFKTQETITAAPVKVLVVGSCAVDVSAQSQDVDTAAGLHSTSPGTVSLTLGGVGRNIAEACHRSGEPALLVSSIGKDSWGRLLHEEMKAIGMRTDGLMECDQRTAVCNLFLDRTGNLVGGVADMRITEELDGSLIVSRIAEHSPRIVALDGNLSSATISTVVNYCVQHHVPSHEPTSVTKSHKILPAIAESLNKTTDPAVSFFTPNLLELAEVYRKAKLEMPAGGSHQENGSDLSFLVDQGIAQMAVALTPFFRHIFIKCGEHGVLAVIRLSGEAASASTWTRERSNPRRRYVVAHGDSGNEILILQHFPALPTIVINSTGAGDSFVGSLLASLQLDAHPFDGPNSLERIVAIAQKAATLTLQSHSSVSPLLSTINLVE